MTEPSPIVALASKIGLAISASLLAAGAALAQSAPGAPPEGDGRSVDLLINDGDSLLNVNGSPSKATSLSFVSVVPGPPLEKRNSSIPGETLSQMVSGFSEHVSTRYRGNYKIVIVHGLGGGNDIRRGATASELYQLLRSYVRSVHALGANAFALVGTYPLQCDIFRDVEKRSVLKSFNDMIYRGWSRPFDSGGLGADGLVDYFADPTIGPNAYSHSPFCSREWSNDGGHLDDAGKAIMGKIESEAIAKLASAH